MSRISGFGVGAGLAPPNTSAFNDASDMIPENERGEKARHEIPDDELFAETTVQGKFISHELSEQYHEHLRKKEAIRDKIEEM